MTTTVTISLPYELSTKLNEYLHAQRRGKSELIRSLLEKEFAESEKEKAQEAVSAA